MPSHCNIRMKAGLLGIVSAMALLLSACYRQEVRSDTVAATPSTPEADFTPEAEHWADSVASAMTDDELVGQLFMPTLFASASPENIRMARFYADSLKVGGFIWLKGSSEEMSLLADSLLSAGRPPLFMAIDAEWGAGMRLQGCTVFRSNSELHELPLHTLYAMGRVTGREASEAGINMILAPVLDVARDPSSVMHRRSFGADPGAVAERASAFARGVSDEGLIAVGKHFPGHGATSLDSHYRLPVIRDSKEKLDSIDLLPFRIYISEGYPAIMTAHVAMPALENGRERAATLSAAILDTLLRGEMEFRGLIISDAMNMLPSQNGVCTEALLAGCDILTAPADVQGAVDEVRRALDSGSLTREQLLEKVKRILFYKYALQL